MGVQRSSAIEMSFQTILSIYSGYVQPDTEASNSSNHEEFERNKHLIHLFLVLSAPVTEHSVLLLGD